MGRIDALKLAPNRRLKIGTESAPKLSCRLKIGTESAPIGALKTVYFGVHSARFRRDIGTKKSPNNRWRFSAIFAPTNRREK